MTSERKIAANRANARRSRGPKTPQGRQRTSKNAFRHGLSLPVPIDCVLSRQAEGLIPKIAGPGANAQIQELARRVVETQLHLRRVRYAREQLLSKALDDYNSQVLREKTKNLDLICEAKVELQTRVARWARENGPLTQIPGQVWDDWSQVQRPSEFPTLLADKLGQLIALGRYESRAVSRRKRAIRAFDACIHRVG